MANLPFESITILMKKDDELMAELDRTIPPHIPYRYVHEHYETSDLYARDLMEVEYQFPDKKSLESKMKLIASGFNGIEGPLLMTLQSLRFKAWNGLPGLYINEWNKKWSGRELCKMLHSFGDKSAEAVFLLGLMTKDWSASDSFTFFEGSLPGTMEFPEDADGYEFWGWQHCFVPNGAGYPYGMHDEMERSRYNFRNIALQGFANFLRKDPRFFSRALQKAIPLELKLFKMEIPVEHYEDLALLKVDDWYEEFDVTPHWRCIKYKLKSLKWKGTYYDKREEFRKENEAFLEECLPKCDEYMIFQKGLGIHHEKVVISEEQKHVDEVVKRLRMEDSRLMTDADKAYYKALKTVSKTHENSVKESKRRVIEVGSEGDLMDDNEDADEKIEKIKDKLSTIAQSSKKKLQKQVNFWEMAQSHLRNSLKGFERVKLDPRDDQSLIKLKNETKRMLEQTLPHAKSKDRHEELRNTGEEVFKELNPQSADDNSSLTSDLESEKIYGIMFDAQMIMKNLLDVVTVQSTIKQILEIQNVLPDILNVPDNAVVLRTLLEYETTSQHLLNHFWDEKYVFNEVYKKWGHDFAKRALNAFPENEIDLKIKEREGEPKEDKEVREDIERAFEDLAKVETKMFLSNVIGCHPSKKKEDSKEDEEGFFLEDGRWDVWAFLNFVPKEDKEAEARREEEATQFVRNILNYFEGDDIDPREKVDAIWADAEQTLFSTLFLATREGTASEYLTTDLRRNRVIFGETKEVLQGFREYFEDYKTGEGKEDKRKEDGDEKSQNTDQMDVEKTVQNTVSFIPSNEEIYDEYPAVKKSLSKDYTQE